MLCRRTSESLLSLLWEIDTTRIRRPGYYTTIPFRRDWGPSWSWISWRISLGFTHSKLPLNGDPFEVRVDIKVPKDNKPRDIMSTIGDYVEDIDKHDGLYQNWLPYLRLSGWITTVCFRHAEYGDGKPPKFSRHDMLWIGVIAGIVWVFWQVFRR